MKLDARGLPEGYNFRPDWEVTPREVVAMRARGEGFLLIDCRTPAENQLVRIEAGELVPLHEIAARVDDLEEHRGRKIITYCHHGVRSLQAAAILRQQGFADVKSMAGGIDLWAADAQPGMLRY